jgi:hypothetical protein
MSPDPDAEEFTLERTSENGAEHKIFRWFKTWVYPKVGGTEYYNEQIFTVRPDGSFARIDIKSGKTNSTHPDSAQTETYEYNPSDLKIESPIK